MSPRPTEPTHTRAVAASPQSAVAPKSAIARRSFIARKNSGTVTAMRRSVRPKAADLGALPLSRVRPWWRRPPGWRAALIAVACFAALAGLVWVVVGSGVLAVREVTVFGAARQDPAAVRAALETEIGRPLARVDTGRATRRVETLPAIKSAVVVRAWPDTLEVRVVERIPLAWAPRGAEYALMDIDGVRLATVTERPADLAGIDLATLAAGERAVTAVMTALHTMPEDVRDQIATAQADTQDSVTFTLRSGATVVWGSSEESARKAEVLSVLVERDAAVYDVSAPRTPVTR
jgi:cell division protein FtsQ